MKESALLRECRSLLWQYRSLLRKCMSLCRNVGLFCGKGVGRGARECDHPSQRQ